MRALSFIFVFILAAFPDAAPAQFKQVFIAKGSDATELSISINPDNIKEIVAGCYEGLYYSNDTGSTWRRNELSCRKSSIHNNPVAFWYNGAMAFCYTKGPDTSIFETTFCRSFAATPGKIMARRSIYLDPGLKVLHATWTEIDAKTRAKRKDFSSAFYSQYNIISKNWSHPERISEYSGDASNNDSTLMGAVCATGLNYEIYTAWAGPKGIMFRNMTVGPGQNLQAEKIIAPLKNGWAYTIGGHLKSNGLPTIVCDLGNGPFKGRIYVCWSDEKHGPANKNVFLSYSDDHGENWTEPVVLTYRPNHKEQFMPYMTIDRSTGFLYILYYDQQNFAEGELTDLYLAQSKNGGLKFDFYKINIRAFKPFSNSYSENYIGLSAVNHVIRPIWVQPDEKNTPAIYTTMIDESALTLYDKNYSEEIEIAKTFTWSDKIKIDFTLNNNSDVSAVITRPLEAGFDKIVFKNKKMLKGKNTFVVDTKSLGLAKGNYTLTLYYSGKNTFVWIVVE